MKALIGPKLTINDKMYFNVGWRIPYKELENIGWVTIDPREINMIPSKFFIQKYGTLPQIIFFWSSEIIIGKYISDILGNKWIKCYYVDDLHKTSQNISNIKDIVLDKFEYIFSSYKYVFQKFNPNVNIEKVIWLPHSINNDFWVEFNDKPQNFVLLSGCIAQNIYPFRDHVYKLARSNKKYPIRVLKHMSYRRPRHNIYGHEYIKYLNSFIAAITCFSYDHTPYVVAKFFEIPASGALLLAYDKLIKKPLEELGFIDGVNYISVDYDNVVEKIFYVTDEKNREEINKIRKNGYDFVWKNHTLMNRVLLIENTLQ